MNTNFERDGATPALSHLLELSSNATPGPWTAITLPLKSIVLPTGVPAAAIIADVHQYVPDVGSDHRQRATNAAFIVAAVNYVRSLESKSGDGSTLKPLASGEEPSEEVREGSFAWLIEAPGPRYLRALTIGHQPRFDWTDDANAALRFLNKDQCDQTMMAIREMQPALFAFEVSLGNAWPREHGWLASRQLGGDEG